MGKLRRDVVTGKILRRTGGKLARTDCCDCGTPPVTCCACGVYCCFASNSEISVTWNFGGDGAACEDFDLIRTGTMTGLKLNSDGNVTECVDGSFTAYPIWSKTEGGVYVEINKSCDSADGWTIYVADVATSAFIESTVEILGDCCGADVSGVAISVSPPCEPNVDPALNEVTITVTSNSCCKDEEGACVSGTPECNGDCQTPTTSCPSNVDTCSDTYTVTLSGVAEGDADECDCTKFNGTFVLTKYSGSSYRVGQTADTPEVDINCTNDWCFLGSCPGTTYRWYLYFVHTVSGQNGCPVIYFTACTNSPCPPTTGWTLACTSTANCDTSAAAVVVSTP